MQMTAGKVKVVLVVSGFDVKRSVEVRLVNKDLNLSSWELNAQLAVIEMFPA